MIWEIIGNVKIKLTPSDNDRNGVGYTKINLRPSAIIERSGVFSPDAGILLDLSGDKAKCKNSLLQDLSSYTPRLVTGSSQINLTPKSEIFCSETASFNWYESSNMDDGVSSGGAITDNQIGPIEDNSVFPDINRGSTLFQFFGMNRPRKVFIKNMFGDLTSIYLGVLYPDYQIPDDVMITYGTASDIWGDNRYRWKGTAIVAEDIPQSDLSNHLITVIGKSMTPMMFMVGDLAFLKDNFGQELPVVIERVIVVSNQEVLVGVTSIGSNKFSFKAGESMLVGVHHLGPVGALDNVGIWLWDLIPSTAIEYSRRFQVWVKGNK